MKIFRLANIVEVEASGEENIYCVRGVKEGPGEMCKTVVESLNNFFPAHISFHIQYFPF